MTSVVAAAAAEGTKKQRKSRSRSRAATVAAASAAVSGITAVPSMALPLPVPVPKKRKISSSKASKEPAVEVVPGAKVPGTKKKNFRNIGLYLHKIWRQHSGQEDEKMANRGAMCVLQDAVYSVIHRISLHVQDLKQKPFHERMPAKANTKKIGARDIQYALRFLMSDCSKEFQAKVLRRGDEAVLRYQRSQQEQKQAAAVVVPSLPSLSTPSVLPPPLLPMASV